MIKVTLIGTGRLSFNLMNEVLNNKRLKLNQIYGRSKFRPKHISDDVEYIKELKKINKSDFYLIAVSDNEIYNVSNQFDAKDGIVVHVSGNTNINVLSNHKNYGVFYPLQTFSYETNLNFREIPIIIEANNKFNQKKIEKFSKIFSKKVCKMSSDKRAICHLSATVANNFTNHLVFKAEQILVKHEIDKKILKPLIKETFNKLNRMTTSEAQTGPALRNDNLTIESHLRQLNESDFLNLYKEITKSIRSNEL